jgi:hypothetical protein
LFLRHDIGIAYNLVPKGGEKSERRKRDDVDCEDAKG